MRLWSSVFLGVCCVGLLVTSSGGCSSEDKKSEDCDVQLVFENSCDGVGCHGSESPRANLDLVSPGVDQRLFYIESTEDCAERMLVVPGQPERSLLYDKVANAESACGDPMPISGSLSGSDISCIRQYIEKAGSDTSGNDCETCGTILCVDVERDPRHCGGCDTACDAGEICADSQCINPCEAGQALCGASCVDLSTTEEHCGACGHRCGPGSSCEAGACTCTPPGDGAGGAGAGGASGVPVGSVSFADDLLPLFENSCSGSDCHTGGERTAPLGLDPSDAWEHLIQQASEGCDSATLVVPGDPDQSYLLDKLLGGNICDGSRMPLASDPLPDAATAQFVSWICDGAPNN